VSASCSDVCGHSLASEFKLAFSRISLDSIIVTRVVKSAIEIFILEFRASTHVWYLEKAKVAIYSREGKGPLQAVKNLEQLSDSSLATCHRVSACRHFFLSLSLSLSHLLLSSLSH
jgi:hypothetical protein